MLRPRLCVDGAHGLLRLGCDVAHSAAPRQSSRWSKVGDDKVKVIAAENCRGCALLGFVGFNWDYFAFVFTSSLLDLGSCTCWQCCGQWAPASWPSSWLWWRWQALPGRWWRPSACPARWRRSWRPWRQNGTGNVVGRGAVQKQPWTKMTTCDLWLLEKCFSWTLRYTIRVWQRPKWPTWSSCPGNLSSQLVVWVTTSTDLFQRPQSRRRRHKEIVAQWMYMWVTHCGMAVPSSTWQGPVLAFLPFRACFYLSLLPWSSQLFMSQPMPVRVVNCLTSN